MRDVTLYELADGRVYSSGPGYSANTRNQPQPAVVGITVAEIEHMKRGAAKLITQNTTLLRERDAARRQIRYLAEYLGVGYDPKEGMFGDGSMAPNVGMFPDEPYGEVVEQRNEARAEAEKMRDFTVTGDELDHALDRAEAAEAQAARCREALERIAGLPNVVSLERPRGIAREALGGGGDGLLPSQSRPPRVDTLRIHHGGSEITLDGPARDALGGGDD